MKIYLLFVFIQIVLNILPKQFQSIFQSIKPPLYGTKIQIGKTLNNNSLQMYIVSKQNISDINNKQKLNTILITSGIYPRQIYTNQLMKKIINKLLQQSNQGKHESILKNSALIFFPFVNIDGYLKYTTVQQKLKQKIIKNNHEGVVTCDNQYKKGVNINRNFDHQFAKNKQSQNQCGQQYRGSKPFSQKQSEAIKYIFSKYKIILNIDIQSTGNSWVYPFNSQKSTQKLKENSLYPFYEKAFLLLSKKNAKYSSYFQKNNNTADGTLIDWAASRNTLSFSYLLGSNFSTAPTDQEYKNAQQQFFELFQLIAPQYTKKIQSNKLILQSTCLKQFIILIKTDKQDRKLISSNEKIQINIPQNITTIQLKIQQTGFYQMINLIDYKQKLKLPVIYFDSNKFLVAFFILNTILYICCYNGFYLKKYKINPAKKNQNKAYQIVQQQKSTDVISQI